MSLIIDIKKDNNDLTISELAKRFQVTERTIRNDIKSINEILSKHNLSDLTLNRGGFICKDESFSKITDFIDGSDFYTYKLSQEERKRIAAALLINSSEYITLSTIADNLFVSRATIINDLDDIKDFIKRGNLEVISHPNKGLRVDGSELDKRKFLMRLVDSDSLDDSIDNPSKLTSVQAGNQLIIKKIVSEQEGLYKHFLTDESFQGIIQYLGIMVNRNLGGEYIEPQPKINNSSYYLMACDILKYVAQYCNIATTEDEIRYFSTFLSKVRYIKKEAGDKAAVKIQLITRQFIEKISEDLGVNLNNDYDFFENLSNHLESVFSTANPEYTDNDLIKEVLETYKDVLEVVTNNILILEQFSGRKIREIELGYITIHVCAALERKKKQEIAFHVVVACHGGIGTSRLLMERLKKHFNFQIVDIISAHEARNVDPSKVDFIIATVPLKNCKVEYVIVSPLLSDEDYLKIGNKIESLRNSRHLPSHIEEKELSASGLIKKIVPVIRDLAPDKEAILLKELKKVVREYFHQPIESESEIFAPYLHHFLTSSHIQLDVECSDWKDAVRKSALPLLKEGYIEKSYIDAMIGNIEENGPYIVISKGFAIPHEGLNAGSIKVGMNLIRLKKPVVFNADELDPVEFVCCLSATDHKSHLKAFFNLVNLLQNEDFKSELRNGKTTEEMSRIVEKYEYNLE
jgi:transcriptional antiterminator/mannitol/fructose-specific phosphotransferase system IIA component (Ntr-type)